MAALPNEEGESADGRPVTPSQHRLNPTRSRTISNSAVEFLETRPEQAFGSEVAGIIAPQAPQYAPEIDRFITASGHAEPDYFKESEERMTRFKKTLSQFCKTLEERKLGKKLGIDIKNPSDYKMQDVLSIAQELQQRRGDDKAAKGCLDKIHRCFRRLAEQRGTLHNLLSFLPNDTYGSPICGGFTVILAAIDRSEDLRGEIYGALAEIPTQIEQINATINIHKLSRELKRRADSVFIAIFEVLESIIQELSKSLIRKTITATLKGEHYGVGVGASLEAMKREIKFFEREAQLCDSKRLGRMEEHTAGTRITVEDTSIKLNDFFDGYERDRDNQNRKFDELALLTRMVFNQLYSFYGAID